MEKGEQRRKARRGGRFNAFRASLHRSFHVELDFGDPRRGGYFGDTCYVQVLMTSDGGSFYFSARLPGLRAGVLALAVHYPPPPPAIETRHVVTRRAVFASLDNGEGCRCFDEQCQDPSRPSCHGAGRQWEEHPPRCTSSPSRFQDFYFFSLPRARPCGALQSHPISTRR